MEASEQEGGQEGWGRREATLMAKRRTAREGVGLEAGAPLWKALPGT